MAEKGGAAARNTVGTAAVIPPATQHESLEKPDQVHGRVAEHAKMLSSHHDRLTNIEHRLGIKPKVGSNFDRDQAGMVKGDPARHEKEPGAGKDKLESMYRRKRHT